MKGSCIKINTQLIFPKTLDRYEGEVHSVILEGKESSLELYPELCKGVMQVIPLVGGNEFWGADFLIAYHLDPQHSHYQWNMISIQHTGSLSYESS